MDDWPHAASYALQSRRILVVEDETLLGMLIEDSLMEAGATVVGTATSVIEALRLIEVAAADGGLSGAVVDLNLRGEAATPVADRLAALGVPFLFSTGYSDGRNADGHESAPVLCKPYEPRELIQALQTLCLTQA